MFPVAHFRARYPRTPMTHPDTRQPNGRFGAGNPGRPPGARARQSQRLIMAILQDFGEHQDEILRRLREHHLPAYVALASRLLPRQIEVGVADPADFTEDQVQLVVTRAYAALGSIDDGHGSLVDLERAVLNTPVVEPVNTDEIR